MLVIADTSPFIVLINIQQLDILPKLFDEIIIPPAVARELKSSSRSARIRRFAEAPPKWLKVKAPAKLLQIPELHPGETEALSLATELHADLLLVDDREAYKKAVARKINAIGTVRVLEMAASEKLLDLQDAFIKLKQTDFWISHQLLDERLKLFVKDKGPRLP